MYKDILVPDLALALDDEDRALGALPAAIALAQAHQAHVCLLVLVDTPPPVPSEWGGVSSVVYARLHEEARARAEVRRELLRKRMADAPVPVEVRIADAGGLYPQSTAALHARYADLAVLPNLPRGSAERLTAHDFFHELLLHSGRPVLVVPPDCAAALPPRRAMVAWKPNAEASRAVHDALPLLRAAEQVEVVVVDPNVDERDHGPEPGADIALHLARHGIRAGVETRPSMNFSVAYALLEQARRSEAELLVAGGYGHSRLRELVLGGVTRELLQSAHLPVLFAH